MPAKDAARLWIEEYANEVGLDYDDLMDGADNFIKDGDYLSQGSLLEGVYTPDEFWIQYEIIRNTKVEDKTNFFSCSC